ncbi:Mucin-19 [Streptomyces sp. NPDC050204]|uniref:Mucin-19 n=1 Tax=Streptomyces sp. NPDC050204 TaxID=3155514 RepID=UPI0034130B13
MTPQQYSEGLAALRQLRDEIKKAQSALDRLAAKRDKQIRSLASHKKAKADRLAPAAGMSIEDLVKIAPELAPSPTGGAATSPANGSTPAPAPTEHRGAPAPGLTPIPADINSPAEPQPATEAGQEPAAPQPAEQPAAHAHPETAAPTEAKPRELPTIPDGAAAERWFTTSSTTKRPNFTQSYRPSVFLDTATGVLAYQDKRIRLDLGSATADEILTAVFATVSPGIQRIIITAGAPWHRDADHHAYLVDAVRAWLEAPMPHGWTAETQRGRDSMAGHFVHERNPVGRWQRGTQHVEIRSAAEWFDPDGADPSTVRKAFVLTLNSLKQYWPDAVLMGSPSQTGRDLWKRTIPTKEGARWKDGYPVMSAELRQLLHATSGQGRTELITPPRVPEQLPRLVELDRTLAYGKHTWASGVGIPERVTAGKFASWTEKEQSNALFSPSHWHVRVTVPDDWNHVGILPAPVEGDRHWEYPYEAGRTFTTWAGGAEINNALRNPQKKPWKIEILDGLLWEKGTPIKDWAEKLKKAWASLSAQAQLAGTDDDREASRLASRAIRSILLYGIGSFAQRPTVTFGTVPVGQESQIPKDARPTGMSNGLITWERTVMRDSPDAQPHWAAGVWSGARAALLSTRADTSDGQTTHVGALHLPPGSIVAFRTDAIYTTVEPHWPYNGTPGDYRLKGMLTEPVTAPMNESDFYTLQTLGRAHLDELQGQH